MKILVIQKKMMGDILMSSVLFGVLRKKYPDAELHYLIEKKYEQIVFHHENIDKIIYFDDFWATLKNVRKEKYNIVVDAYAKVETAVISWLSGASERISFYKKYTNPFYTHTIDRTDEVKFPLLSTALEHRLKLLSPLGIEIAEEFPKIYISEQEKDDADNLLNNLGISDEDLIMMSTFGSVPEKTYPISYMAKVINHIAENTNAKILCNYLPSQKDDFLKLYGELSDIAKNQVIKDFDTENLRQYIAVLAKCKVLIGNEGGSTNISKALKVPTFSIYAPGVSGWDWCLDGVKNVSIHAGDYQVVDYDSFTPNLFQDELIKFLKNNI